MKKRTINLFSPVAMVLGAVSILPSLPHVSWAAPVTGAVATARLDTFTDGKPTGWTFSNGAEVPGAKGTLEVAAGPDGKPALKLVADFTGGGAYCAAGTTLAGAGLLNINAVKMRVKSANTTQLDVQMIDSTGQTHQVKHLLHG